MAIAPSPTQGMGTADPINTVLSGLRSGQYPSQTAIQMLVRLGVDASRAQSIVAAAAGGQQAIPTQGVVPTAEPAPTNFPRDATRPVASPTGPRGDVTTQGGLPIPTGTAPTAPGTTPLTGQPLPSLFGGGLAGAPTGDFGWAFAPWSETQGERNLSWDAAFAKGFGNVPSMLYGNVPSMEGPMNAAYLLQRGMGNIPVNATFGGFLGNPSVGGGWNNLINQAVGILGHNYTPQFGGGPGTALQPGASTAMGTPYDMADESGYTGAFGGNPSALAGLTQPPAGAAAGSSPLNLGAGFQNFLKDNQGLQLQTALASIMPQIPMFLADAMTKVANNVFSQWQVQQPQGLAAMGVDPMSANFLPWFQRNNYSFGR